MKGPSPAGLTLCAALLAGLLAVGARAHGEEPLQELPGVVHVHTTVSSGDTGLGDLVKMAQELGLEALVVTDHDRVVMEYGLYPFQGVLSKKESRPSVATYGAERYLDDITRINREQKEVVVVPGVQCSPFYYWTGNLLSGLTAHDFRKELLIIGMEEPADYDGIPEIHGSLSLRNFGKLWPRSLLFALPLAAGLFLVSRKGRRQKAWGTALCLVGAGLAVSNHPFSATGYDAYHGDQGIAPFQETITWAERHGGLVFWAHPESSYSHRGVKMGPVTLQTRKHPEALLASRGTTGFCALYGDTTQAEQPGREWDRALAEYCRGEREKPVWAIAEADWHDQAQGMALDDLATFFLVRQKSVAGVLEALSAGRTYAIRKTGKSGLRLSGFLAKDPETGKGAGMGGTLSSGEQVEISGTVTASDGGSYPVEGLVVKDGAPWKSFAGTTPQPFSFTDEAGPGCSFYRLLVKGQGAQRLVSNPVFVRRAM
ncbi:MAG: PHP domain-containing protein [Thermodesulfobacteriota bacterium]